jgi:chemotaxis protein CheD
MNVVVGVGDCCVTSDPGSVLITYALGSCIGIALHDPVAHVGGLLHFMLPSAPQGLAESGRSPWMYADTGIPLLFRQAYERGAQKGRLRVHAAGGALIMDEAGVFNIGQRNCVALRKILWRAGIMLTAEDTGGSDARTMRLEVASGRVYLRSVRNPGEKEL